MSKRKHLGFIKGDNTPGNQQIIEVNAQKPATAQFSSYLIPSERRSDLTESSKSWERVAGFALIAQKSRYELRGLVHFGRKESTELIREIVSATNLAGAVDLIQGKSTMGLVLIAGLCPEARESAVRALAKAEYSEIFYSNFIPGDYRPSSCLYPHNERNRFIELDRKVYHFSYLDDTPGLVARIAVEENSLALASHVFYSCLKTDHHAADLLTDFLISKNVWWPIESAAELGYISDNRIIAIAKKLKILLGYVQEEGY